MRILIAEDDPTSRLVLERTLRRWGHEVIATSGGDDAWAALGGADAPRLAILDWMMPDLDGVEVCRRVRALDRESLTYVILLTALGRKEDVVAGLEAGADDYVTKPFDQDELRARIRVGERLIEFHDQVVSLKEALRVQALHDALTGILNRRAIIERLEAELARSRREGKTLSVAMIDLDHFKNVNDTYGHTTGDEVLRESAHRIRRVLRTYDAVGRYGGEEFLVVVADADSRTTASICERIRSAIAARKMAPGQGGIQTTASLGVVTVGPGMSMEDAINAADAALYEAKAAGRDRVAYADAV